MEGSPPWDVFRAEIDRINRGAGTQDRCRTRQLDETTGLDFPRIDREAIAGRHHRSAN